PRTARVPGRGGRAGGRIRPARAGARGHDLRTGTAGGRLKRRRGTWRQQGVTCRSGAARIGIERGFPPPLHNLLREPQEVVRHGSDLDHLVDAPLADQWPAQLPEVPAPWRPKPAMPEHTAHYRNSVPDERRARPRTLRRPTRIRILGLIAEAAEQRVGFISR